ncbi:MAG: FtsQ-type POTRA domain-containing protein [Acidobacteria bacterium]|nr:FtsQ-type POTRA domain-containing protein [Acidobacteriota bacterium]MBK8812167.1 FtsQ-type POTRA domain-containing protein [Acidobacteriota bacterium]
MAKRTRRTTVRTTNKSAPKRRTTRRAAKSNGNLVNFLVPLVFIVAIIGCLGFLAFMGYRTVTASEFFEVRKIDVRGAARVPKESVEGIVRNLTERSGVWNADLTAIRERVESLSFVKSAAVSRVLPDGVRVQLTERVPKAAVRIDGSEFWVDDEANVVAPVAKNEQHPPLLTGWDQNRNEKAQKENVARVKIYQKMVDEWKTFDLIKRVKTVNLSDLDEPRVIIEDSGTDVFIELGKDEFGKHLQRGIEGIANKGGTYEGIKLVGQNLRLIPRQVAGNGKEK